MGDTIIWWCGAAVIVSAALAISALLLWQALEFAVNAFKIKRLILEYHWDKLRAKRGRVISKKVPTP